MLLASFVRVRDNAGMENWSDGSDTNAMNRVVILLGTNYSGSHLLSHLLSSHSACVGVGELHRYTQLVAGDTSAPVVSQYTTSPLFADLEGLPISRWHEVIEQRIRDQLAIPAPVIIDNSKKIRWVEQVAQGSRLDLRIVHLLRDPRALVLRWLNTYGAAKQRRIQRIRVAKRVPSRAVRILLGNWSTVFTYKWLRENRQISQFIARTRYPHAVVTYRDMVFDTQSMLTRLMPRFGLSFEPAQLRFGESNLHGTIKTAHAQVVSQSEIRPDLKWQTQLDQSASAAIVGNKDVVNYLKSLGLHCGSNGLQSIVDKAHGVS